MARARENEAKQIAAEERHRTELATREAQRSAELATQAKAEVETARRSAEATKQQAEASIARTQLESDSAVRAAQEARSQTELALKQAEQARSQAEQARSEANQLLADARTKQNALSQEVELSKQQAEQSKQQAEQSKQRAEQLEKDRLQAREELRRQLNVVFITRENARGLVLSMSGVLFDTGKNNLLPGAREKLAKVAGILQTHPALKIEVEGHTDSTGSVATNEKLSAARAQSVRDYLVNQGVNSAAISFVGKGSTTPVASNTTAAGRQQNRRVELVVSGAEVAPQTPAF
jgi:outer membrane protein OmpA-like peptidoglycan-associated protein